MTGKGRRLIISDAMTESGPVRGALWMFKADGKGKKRKIESKSKELSGEKKRRKLDSESPGGGAHKHFFDRDARPRTNFNYPKK